MQTASLSKPTLLKSCQRKVLLFLNNVKRVRWRDGWSVTWKRVSPAPLRAEDFRETRQNRKNKPPTYGKPLWGAQTHTVEQIYSMSIKYARKSPSARHQSYPGVWCLFMRKLTAVDRSGHGTTRGALTYSQTASVPSTEAKDKVCVLMC